MIKGTAFWRQDEDGQNTHLRFIISEPDPDNMVLIVGMTTLYNTGREDLSCVLQKGDHSCVVAPSWIRYDKVSAINYLSLLRERHRGLIYLRRDISQSLLKRIQEGAKSSPALPQKFRKYFQFF